jgi:hypothetical protein
MFLVANAVCTDVDPFGLNWEGNIRGESLVIALCYLVREHVDR